FALRVSRTPFFESKNFSKTYSFWIVEKRKQKGETLDALELTHQRHSIGYFWHLISNCDQYNCHSQLTSHTKSDPLLSISVITERAKMHNPDTCCHDESW